MTNKQISELIHTSITHAIQYNISYKKLVGLVLNILAIFEVDYSEEYFKNDIEAYEATIDNGLTAYQIDLWMNIYK